MKSYIPEGMLEKQYHWEQVNYQLYQHLQSINPYLQLDNIILEMVKKQELQLNILCHIAEQYGIGVKKEYIQTQYYPEIFNTIDELHDRELQLLQEYLSYYSYFLTSDKQLNSYLIRLINYQNLQVNRLIEMKDTIFKLEDGNKYSSELIKYTSYLLEKGYYLEKVVDDLTFPTDVSFDNMGNIYVVEAGFAYGTEPREGQILQINRDGQKTRIAGGFDGPVTSIYWYRDHFYVAEGARGGNPGIGCGQITKVSMDGKRTVLISGLKSCGDHFTGEVIVGPDEKLYFTVGTATNSAVVGLDNIPWLKKHPYFHDTPARDLTLRGNNFISTNPLTDGVDIAVTGAYKPFGVPSYDGEIIKGSILSNGVIYCSELDGSNLSIIADGFRNPFGLKFSPFNGRLYATDNGADPRGNRPIQHDWDNFWEIQPGWYGWPDFFSGLPSTLPHFHVEDKVKPTFLLKHHPTLIGQPLTRFKRHTSSNKFDFSTSQSFGHIGEIFVAQIGDMDWGHHQENYGFKVVRANIESGQIRNFLVNPDAEKNKLGPIRPVTAKFNPTGDMLYVVDFGILGSVDKGLNPEPKTGTLWRVVRS
ncbi:MAG: glucose dehydrogenase [Firmicutes bacterium]|nr:glucose dehydrogenase [Bacillota bacterium]